MKRKIIILLFMLCFLTGCEVEYKLQYVNNEFIETTNLTNLEGLEEEVKNIYNVDLSTNYLDISDLSKEEGLDLGYTYYEKHLNENNGLTLSYRYNFLKDDYKNSQIGRTAFPKMNFSNNILSSGNIKDIFVLYPELEKITIEFKTDKYIINTNADKEENGVYYWFLERNNPERKNIKVSMSDEDHRDFIDKLKDETKNIDDDTFDNIFNYIFIVIGISLFILFFVVFIKFKTSNKK